MYRANAGLIFFVIIWLLIISVGIISKLVKAVKSAQAEFEGERGSAADSKQDELWEPQVSPAVQRSTPPPVPRETQPRKQKPPRQSAGELAPVQTQLQQKLQRQEEVQEATEGSSDLHEDASLDVWEKKKPRTRMKINLRSVKDLRHAVIVREILERPRAFDT